jgi:hypothetical protein
MPIPRGITRSDVLEAIAQFDLGVPNNFGPATRYELVYDGRTYPPKAVIGLAATRVLGRPLSSQEFSGGEDDDQANGRLRALGFEVRAFRPYGGASAPRETAPTVSDATWSIEPGTRLRRQEVHALYGGAPRGGIEPSARTPNVLIFSEPEKAAEHSYGFDGWAASDLLHYTGEGRNGDQRFVEGNKAILEHVAQRRALRVFRAKPPWATYLGEFEVDQDTPYYLADSPGVDGLMRQVIVFRLRPVGTVVDGGLGSAPEPPGGPTVAVTAAVVDAAVATAVATAPESVNVEGYVAAPSDEPIEHMRREAALVQRYQQWLDRQGHEYSRHQIRLPGELSVLYTDLYDTSARELVEAKASSSRNSVRTGLGQLLDYSRFVPHDRRSLLLPVEPRPDLLGLLRAHGCGCIWETERGQFVRIDP